MSHARHVLLVRHGETVGNLERIAHGQSESPLNERGQRQAELTAKLLVGWERSYARVVTSPLSRARDTGRAIARALGLPTREHGDLLEGHLGRYEGVTYQELDDSRWARHCIKDDDYTGHGGESPNQVGARMYAAIETELAEVDHGNLIVVSHGGAIAQFLARALGTRPAFGPQYMMQNAAVTELVFRPEPELLTLNHHDHLPEELRLDPARRDE